MTTPCYDRVNHQDCPERHAGCAATCPKWAEYVKKRDERYLQRKRRCEGHQDYLRVRKRRVEAYTKDNYRRGKYKNFT